MQTFTNLFAHPVFVVVSGISTLIVILGIGVSIVFWVRGALPVLYRLGMGLSKRRIAVFADEQYESLKDMLIDSKIFKRSNIIRINKDDLKKAEPVTLLLVHYKPFVEEMERILSLKGDSHALIVYAPQNEGRIEDKLRDQINGERNSILVNFRGRLMNDILGCMMTTSYQSR